MLYLHLCLVFGCLSISDCLSFFMASKYFEYIYNRDFVM
jgi:hypothetical protein